MSSMQIFRKIILSLVFLDNFIMRSIKSVFPRDWELSGGCKKCGKCCQEIFMGIRPILLKAKYPLKIIVAWIEWLFDFKLKSIDRQSSHLIFTCNNIGPDGLCKNYFWRPNICRNFPIVDYFEEPNPHSWCGYKIKCKQDIIKP